MQFDIKFTENNVGQCLFRKNEILVRLTMHVHCARSSKASVSKYNTKQPKLHEILSGLQYIGKLRNDGRRVSQSFLELVFQLEFTFNTINTISITLYPYPAAHTHTHTLTREKNPKKNNSFRDQITDWLENQFEPLAIYSINELVQSNCSSRQTSSNTHTHTHMHEELI